MKKIVLCMAVLFMALATSCSNKEKSVEDTAITTDTTVTDTVTLDVDSSSETISVTE